MSGLVQPAGDASIDLGSDLTPGPLHSPPSSSANPETTSFAYSGLLVAKPPLPVRGGRRDRGRKRQRESAGRQGVDVRDGSEVDTRGGPRGSFEGGWRTSKSGLPELPPQLRTFTLTSSTSSRLLLH